MQRGTPNCVLEQKEKLMEKMVQYKESGVQLLAMYQCWFLNIDKYTTVM